MVQKRIVGRADLIAIFNASHFALRHYARGYFPVFNSSMRYMSLNRMFFPLKNPNGPQNYISDSFRQYELIPGNMYFVPAFLPVRFQLDGQLFFLSIQTNLEIFPGGKRKHCDVAAVKIIVKEAGGKVTNFFGKDQRYDTDINGAIISNGIVHDEVINILKKCIKE